MSKKYAFLGPESTGKSTLALELAAKLDGIYVCEMARDYLADIGLNYTCQDIINIARLQIESEKRISENKLIFCDTELITIQIWLDYFHYEVPKWIVDSIHNSDYEVYFLCDIDIPWVADPLRTNKYDRQNIMQRFIDKLEFYKKCYVLISGNLEKRINQVENIIKI